LDIKYVIFQTVSTVTRRVINLRAGQLKNHGTFPTGVRNMSFGMHPERLWDTPNLAVSVF